SESAGTARRNASAASTKSKASPSRRGSGFMRSGRGCRGEREGSKGLAGYQARARHDLRCHLRAGWDNGPYRPGSRRARERASKLSTFGQGAVWLNDFRMTSFYITTAIDYVNGSPHLGHAYEKVLTDVIARFRRQMGDTVHFLTGTDEHGQKVQASARKLGIAPQAFADQVSAEFRALLPRLNISNDDFIRTTEERHKKVVRDVLQRLF